MKPQAIRPTRRGCHQQARHTAGQPPQWRCHRSSSRGAASNASNAAWAAGAQPQPVQPWRQVVAVCAGCLLLCNLHRSTFSILLPDLCQQLQLSASQAGAVQSAMLTAYLAGQVPAGRLADRDSAPAVLLCGCALWSAATALTAAAGPGVGVASGAAALWALAVLVVSRALMGLASACAMPCVTAATRQWVPPSARSSAIAFIYANFNVGGVAGLSLAPLLAESFGGGGAFIIAGAAGLVWAAVGAVMLSRLPPPPAAVPPPPTPAAAAEAAAAPKAAVPPTPTPAAAAEAAAAPKAAGEEPQAAAQRPATFRLLSWRLDGPSLRQLLLLMYVHGVIGAGFFVLQSFLPMYVASLGSTGAATGRLSSTPWLAAAVVGMTAGAAADGLIRRGLPPLLVRRVFQGASFLGCGLSVLPLALSAAPSVPLAVLCLTANLACYSLSFGGFHPYLQDVAGDQAGLVQGLTNSSSILVGIAGNMLTGVLVDATGAYSAVFAVLAAVYASAAVVWLATSSSQCVTLQA